MQMIERHDIRERATKADQGHGQSWPENTHRSLTHTDKTEFCFVLSFPFTYMFISLDGPLFLFYLWWRSRTVFCLCHGATAWNFCILRIQPPRNLFISFFPLRHYSFLFLNKEWRDPLKTIQWMMMTIHDRTQRYYFHNNIMKNKLFPKWD